MVLSSSQPTSEQPLAGRPGSLGLFGRWLGELQQQEHTGNASWRSKKQVSIEGFRLPPFVSACSIARSSFSRATDSAGLQVSGVKKWATIALLPIHLQASIFRHAKLARQDDPGVEHPGFCTSVIRSSDTLASGKRKRTGARCSALFPRRGLTAAAALPARLF
jgi:hypothetical protein